MHLQERITVILLEGFSMLNASPRQGKVPGTTSGRYLLLEIDPKDRQVDPAGCHSLPLLPHVWNDRDSDQVSKIPPDFKLWQWQETWIFFFFFLTWAWHWSWSKLPTLGGNRLWNLRAGEFQRNCWEGRRENVRLSPTILIKRPSVNPLIPVIRYNY